MSGEALRLRRRRWVYGVAIVTAVLIGLWLLLALRSLLLPTTIGAMLAYLARPLLQRLQRLGIPRGLATAVLTLALLSGVFVLVNHVRAAVPDQRGKLELRVRVQYMLHKRFDEVMGLEVDPRGNVLFRLFGREIQPMLTRLESVLAPDDEERALFERYLRGGEGGAAVDSRVAEYYRVNLRRLDQSAFNTRGSQIKKQASVSSKQQSSHLGAAINVLSLWLVTPFIFLFLMLDDGRIKKWALSFAPNRYFEMTLTIVERVDHAIGRYLRGTLMECSLVGLTFVVGLGLIGIEPGWAVLIGVLAGLANAIPFLGPVIGLVIGLGYALIVEQITPLLPLVTLENLPLAVLAVVGTAQLLDNAVFQPVVLGKVVNLHPLVIVLGVMGGSILFGFVGMLFAIPTIVVVRVVIKTLFEQLHAYRVI